jgi:uncharacterized protein YjbJ (UPF0337 family)
MLTKIDVETNRGPGTVNEIVAQDHGERSDDQDVFAGQWKQMRGELKSWWGKLADDDFDRIGGQQDKLIGVLQEKYGYARAQAQQEVEQRLKAYGDTMGRPSGNGMPDNAPHEGAIATAVAAVAGGLESAEGAIATAATAIAGGLESVEGAIATAATAVAGGLESANSYLQEKEYAEMATDLTALMRRYPVQSLLIGVGLGYVLARLTTR